MAEADNLDHIHPTAGQIADEDGLLIDTATGLIVTRSDPATRDGYYRDDE